jgi:hypothetical protein
MKEQTNHKRISLTMMKAKISEAGPKNSIRISLFSWDIGVPDDRGRLERHQQMRE